MLTLPMKAGGLLCLTREANVLLTRPATTVERHWTFKTATREALILRT